MAPHAGAAQTDRPAMGAARPPCVCRPSRAGLVLLGSALSLATPAYAWPGQRTATRVWNAVRQKYARAAVALARDARQVRGGQRTDRPRGDVRDERLPLMSLGLG